MGWHEMQEHLEDVRSALLDIAKEEGLPRLLDAIDEGETEDEKVLDAVVADLRDKYRWSPERAHAAVRAGVLAGHWMSLMRQKARAALAPEVEGDH